MAQLKNKIIESKINGFSSTPNYGYYYFKPYMFMLLIFLLTGLSMIVWGVQQKFRPPFYLGIAVCLYGLVTTLVWGLARYVIPGSRISVARKALDKIKIKGNEKIIDIGSGRGLYAIEAAKKIEGGSVFAIDIWEPEKISHLKFQHKLSQPTGNTLNNALHNAELAGVKGKIKFLNMDVNYLEFSKNTFDVVICGFILGHQRQYRKNAMREIYRVLNTGGKLLLVDNVCDFVYFMLSTPHLFILSCIRNTKARQLTRKKWLEDVVEAGFRVTYCSVGKGQIIISAVKQDNLY